MPYTDAGFYEHPRTGRLWANEAMAIQMDGPLTNPAPGYVQVGEFAVNNGGPVPGPQQIVNSSQFWMSSGYNGPEPTIETKAAYSDAQYAYDWAGAYAQTLQQQGVQVSPAIAAIANNFTGVQATTAALWKAIPQASPLTALMQTLGLNQPSSPSGSPGSTSNPGAGTGGQAGATNTNTAGSGTSTTNPAATGSGSAGGSPLDTIAKTASGLGNYGIYILGAVVMIAVIGLFMFKGSSPAQVKA